MSSVVKLPVPDDTAESVYALASKRVVASPVSLYALASDKVVASPVSIYNVNAASLFKISEVKAKVPSIVGRVNVVSSGSPVGSGAVILISLKSPIGPSKTNFAPSRSQIVLSFPVLSESGYKLIPAGDLNSISPVKTVDDRRFSFPCDKSLKATVFLQIYYIVFMLFTEFLHILMVLVVAIQFRYILQTFLLLY